MGQKGGSRGWKCNDFLDMRHVLTMMLFVKCGNLCATERWPVTNQILPKKEYFGQSRKGCKENR